MEKKEGRVKVPDTCAEAAELFARYSELFAQSHRTEALILFHYVRVLRLLGDTPLTANFVLEFDWEKFS